MLNKMQEHVEILRQTPNNFLHIPYIKQMNVLAVYIYFCNFSVTLPQLWFRF